MRTKIVIASMTLALAGSALAGCGSQGDSSASSAGDYCTQLKADKAYFTGLSGSGSADFSKIDEMFTRLHALSAAAPSDVASDWKTLDSAVTTIQQALQEAGIKPSDLAAMQKGQLPPGADLKKLQALAPKLQALSSTDVSNAAQAIAKNAKATCGVDLNAS